MKKLFSLYFLLLMAAVLSTALLSSCDDNESASDGTVTLLSFGPTGVKHGEKIKFIGKNLNKVSSIILTPNIEIPSANFDSQSNTIIELTVPDATEAGKVMLKTPDGDIESKTVLSFNVPVTISSITQQAKPGTNITITGKFLNWVEEIVFANNLSVTEFVSQSVNELVVTVPMEAKTGLLIFKSGGTEPLSFNSDNALTVTLPAVTSLTPSPVEQTKEVTLSGTNLDLVTKIKFPGDTTVFAANFKSKTESSIVVRVPKKAMAGKLVLTAPSGVEVEPTTELSILLPNVTAFSPESTLSHMPGTTLTLIGTNLTQVKSLRFPNVAQSVSSFISKSDTEIQVVIPDGASGGTVVITTIHDYVVPISQPFGNQLTLAKVIYDDAIKTPLGAGGGWGGVTTDVASTENPRAGSKSIKVTFAGSWGGGAQFGNWSTGQTVSTAGASFYAFSVYGGAGTAGKKMNVNVSGKQVVVTIAEGEWTDFKLPLSDFNSPAGIGEIWFQDQGWSGVIFIDHIGLK